MRRDRDQLRAEETQRIDMRMHEQSVFEEQAERRAQGSETGDEMPLEPQQDNVTPAGQQRDRTLR